MGDGITFTRLGGARCEAGVGSAVHWKDSGILF